LSTVEFSLIPPLLTLLLTETGRLLSKEKLLGVLGNEFFFNCAEYLDPGEFSDLSTEGDDEIPLFSLDRIS
jgi:hypothetical protein